MNIEQASKISGYGVKNPEQVAKVFGLPVVTIPVLVRARLLKPLGNPAPNAPKWFAAVDIMQLAQDRDWLDKATRAINRHWRKKNQGRRKNARPNKN